MSDGFRGVHCLVLGAGGFIGSHLCHALVAQGAVVHGFGRPPKYPDCVPPMRWTLGEFSDREKLAEALEGSEMVFHLLGGTHPEISNKDPLGDLQQNTAASVQLLELCRAARVRRFVFLSSGGTVYGVPQAVPIAETAATEPISAYGINKLMVEKYLLLYRRLHGLDSISLRVANPFGPFQNPYRGQGVVAALIETFLHRRKLEIWGDGSVIRDFIFAGDLVDAVLRAALYQGPHQVLNIGSGIGRSLLEVVDGIAGTLGLERPALIYKPGRQADVPANVLDITLARQVLDWAPRTGWAEALALTAEWIRQAHPAP